MAYYAAFAAGVPNWQPSRRYSPNNLYENGRVCSEWRFTRNGLAAKSRGEQGSCGDEVDVFGCEAGE